MIAIFLTLTRFLRGIRYGLKDPEFKGLFFIVVIMLLSGTIFYSQVEHWKIIDSLYFSIITLTTIGYGDFAPKTDLGKIFTMIYIFVGIGTLLGFVNLIAQHAQKNDPIARKFFTKNDKESAKRE